MTSRYPDGNVPLREVKISLRDLMFSNIINFLGLGSTRKRQGCSPAGKATASGSVEDVESIARRRGLTFGENWVPSAPNVLTDFKSHVDSAADAPNLLREFFEARKEGRGVWKWLHYFEIYHRHLSRFVGRQVHVLEVGVYSGGSLDMWRDYFGPNLRIYGVDIAKGCKQYEDANTKIFIGDQADRDFWRGFREHVPVIDVLIDDGGHEAEQQIVTLEEMLPHIQPGGVYVCEDIHGLQNDFASYIGGLAKNLNGAVPGTWKAVPEGHTADRTPFQREIKSIHLYPFVAIIEKAFAPLDRLVSRKQGTQWKPYAE